MRRTIMAACVIAAVITGSAAVAADGSSVPRGAVKQVAGPLVDVAPLSVTGVGEYDLRCPAGYLVTGVGVLNGATQIVYAVPNFGGRTASFAFANDSDLDTWQAAGSITCVRGEHGLRVRAASVSPDMQERLVQQAR